MVEGRGKRASGKVRAKSLFLKEQTLRSDARHQMPSIDATFHFQYFGRRPLPFAAAGAPRAAPALLT